ncbi:MAG: hypothetical protein ACOH2H_21530 [Cypionkella sp.]
MISEQQMRWSEQGANLHLQVRLAMVNKDEEDRFAYQTAAKARRPITLTFVREFVKA